MCRGDLEEERRKRGKPVRRLMVVVKRVGVTGEDAGGGDGGRDLLWWRLKGAAVRGSSFLENTR